MRCHGEAVEPLLLALTVDIITSITSYLTSSHIIRLIMAGSSQLNASLQLRGGVQTLRLFYAQQIYPRPVPSPSLISMFAKLTTFEVSLPQIREDAVPDWKVSQLPSTLTCLDVNQKWPLFPFIKETSDEAQQSLQTKDVYPKASPMRGSYPPELWFHMATLFPRLAHLALRAESPQQRGISSWIDSFPKTLTTLHLPFLDSCYLAEDAGRTRSRVVQEPEFWTDLLPPHLTSLSLKQTADSPVYTALNRALPHRITSFHTSGDLTFELLKYLPWLIELSCGSIELESGLSNELRQPSNRGQLIRLIPRGLKSLSVVRYLGIQGCQESALAEIVPLLPKGLTYLNGGQHLSIYFTRYLTAPLEHLIVQDVLFQEHMPCPLPATLRTLRMNHIIPLDQKPVLPPHLERLYLAKGYLQDSWLASFPDSLTWVSTPEWRCEGFLLPPSATEASLSSITKQLRQNPYIDNDALKGVVVSKLKYLPEACREISDHLITNDMFTYAQLPRGLTTLPSSYMISDRKDMDLRDLPRGLRQLTIADSMTIGSWLSLPLELTKVNGGSLKISTEEIRRCMKAINRDIVTGTSFVFPTSLIDLFLKEHDERICQFEYPDIIRQILAETPIDTHCSKECLDLLPASVEHLTVVTFSNKVYDHSTDMFDVIEEPSPASEDSVNKTPSQLTSVVVRPHVDPKVNSIVRFLDLIPSTLVHSGLTLTDLPPSLEHLELRGVTYINDLQGISRFRSLKSLTLDTILKPIEDRATAAPVEEYHSLLQNLPSSLVKLHILNYPACSKHLEAIPRSVTDLVLLSHPAVYSPQDLQALPSGLVTLGLNTKVFADGLRAHLPATITKLTLKR